MTARLVVLVSGEGTNLQALLDACADPAYGAQVVAVGADRDGTRGLERAAAAGLPTFVVRLADCPDRAAFDAAVLAAVKAHRPDLLVLAGYLKILGPAVIQAVPTINTHPSLLPSFPGAHAVRDTLAYGVQVTGCSIFVVDEGVDAGPILAQAAVAVAPGDDETSLHEQIKLVERSLLVDTVGRLVAGPWHVEGRTVVFG